MIDFPYLCQESTPQETPAEPAAQPGSPFGSWIPILLVLVIFYMVLVLPERKKQKKRQSMLEALKKGDRVMTSSGIYGTVVQVASDVVVLQVADNVRLRFTRAAIQSILTGESALETPSESKEPARG